MESDRRWNGEICEQRTLVRFTAEKNFSNASGVNVQMADDSGVTLRGGWRKRGVDQQLPRWRYCLRRPSVLPQAQV